MTPASFTIAAISMSDSIVQGNLTATSFEQMTSTGKHTPTLYVNGRCKAEGRLPRYRSPWHLFLPFWNTE